MPGARCGMAGARCEVPGARCAVDVTHAAGTFPAEQALAAAEACSCLLQGDEQRGAIGGPGVEGRSKLRASDRRPSAEKAAWHVNARPRKSELPVTPVAIFGHFKLLSLSPSLSQDNASHDPACSVTGVHQESHAPSVYLNHVSQSIDLALTARIGGRVHHPRRMPTPRTSRPGRPHRHPPTRGQGLAGHGSLPFSDITLVFYEQLGLGLCAAL